MIYTYEPKLKDGNSFVGKLERKKGEEVGEYAIEQGSLAISTKNYKIVFKSGIFNIFLGEVIVSADYQEKVYGEEDPEFTYKIVKGLPEKLKNLISGTLSREEGEDVGTYNITQGELKIKGYRVKFVPSKMEITKATQLITWNQELIFDCDAKQKTVLLTATTNSDLPITYDVYDTTVASVSKNILSFHNSGSTKIKAIQKGNKNYLPAPEVELPIIGKITNLISRYSKNTLIFNNASRNYVAWQWYKNGKLIPGATKQYYTDTFLKGSYYVEAKTKEGHKELSCSFKITDSFYFEDKLIKLYPNPVVHKELFSVKLNYDEKALEGAYLIVYDIRGKAITRIPKVKKITQITAPDATGIYVVKLTLYNGTYESINLLVK